MNPEELFEVLIDLEWGHITSVQAKEKIMKLLKQE